MTIDRFFGEYRYLSNFWHVPIRYNSKITFPTVEHAYQWEKLDHSGLSDDQYVDVLCLFVDSTPGQAKKMGREFPIVADWDQIKDDVMRKYLDQKFAPDSELATALMGTHPQELIEGNTWGDVYWGQCNGVGKNKLGEMLMAIRNQLIFFERNPHNPN